MKFLDIFNEIEKGNYALTDEAIYASIRNGDEMIPLWGGNKEHITCSRKVSESASTLRGVPITVFSGEGIIISLDGSAGSMTYKNGERFALNHHAGFITLKDEARKIVDLKYFSLFFQNHYRSLSVSDGSKTLSLNQIYNEDFDLPDYDTQINIVQNLNKVAEAIIILDFVKDRLSDLMCKEIAYEYKKYQVKEAPINQCLEHMGGNPGLTEEFIYSTLQQDNHIYQVLSATSDGASALGCIPESILNGKPVKVFEGKAGLLTVRIGNAGSTTFLKPGKYSLTDNAYILSVKDSCKYKIDLNWLSHQYKKDFIEYSTNSDYGVWNMTGFFTNVKIDIPEIDEQIEYLNLWKLVEEQLSRIEKIQSRFNDLIDKQIAFLKK